MFETATEYNTVSDAAKDIVKILLPLCVNDDVLYDLCRSTLALAVIFRRTEHFNTCRRV